MLEKYINSTNKKFIATTLALTLTFSSCATLSSFKTNAEGEVTNTSGVMNNIQLDLENESTKIDKTDEATTDEEYDYEYYYEDDKDEYEEKMEAYIKAYLDSFDSQVQNAEAAMNEAKAAMDKAKSDMDEAENAANNYVYKNLYQKTQKEYKNTKKTYEEAQEKYKDALKFVEKTFEYTVYDEYTVEDNQGANNSESTLNLAKENEDRAEKVLADFATKLSGTAEENSEQLESTLDSVYKLENDTDIALLKTKATEILKDLEEERSSINKELFALKKTIYENLKNGSNSSNSNKADLEAQKSSLQRQIDLLNKACQTNTKAEFESILEGNDNIIAKIQELIDDEKTENTSDDSSASDLVDAAIENSEIAEDNLITALTLDTEEYSDQLDELIDELIKDKNEADLNVSKAKALVDLNSAQNEYNQKLSDTLDEIEEFGTIKDYSKLSDKVTEAYADYNAANKEINAILEETQGDDSVTEEADLEKENSSEDEEEYEYEYEEYEDEDEDEYEYEYEYEDEYYKVNYNYMKYENDEDYDAELHELLVYKLSVNNKLEEAEYDYDQAKRDLASIYSNKTVQESSNFFISDYTKTESIVNETQVKEAKEKVDSALKEKRGLEKMAEAIDDAFFAHAGSQEYLERYENKVVLDLEILSTFEFNIYELNEALKEAKTAMKENENTDDYSEYEAAYEEAKKELEDEISNVENQGYEVVKSTV